MALIYILYLFDDEPQRPHSKSITASFLLPTYKLDQLHLCMLTYPPRGN